MENTNEIENPPMREPTLKEQIETREKEVQELKAKERAEREEKKKQAAVDKKAIVATVELTDELVKRVQKTCYAYNKLSKKQKADSDILKAIVALVEDNSDKGIAPKAEEPAPADGEGK